MRTLAAALGLGVLTGAVIGAIHVRRARSIGQGRVIWSLPIALAGILAARAYVWITATSSEPGRWAALLILFLGGITTFVWSKNRGGRLRLRQGNDAGH